jgi:hypothetical protein
MKHHMDKSTRIWLVIVMLVVVAILATLGATATLWFSPYPWEHRPLPSQYIPGDIEFFYTAKTVVSTINVTLLIFLLLTYLSIYIKTRSEFSIGLVIFSIVFLLNALASNPLVMWAFGFRPFGLGPFALLPDLFTFAALAVMLYLSIE